MLFMKILENSSKDVINEFVWQEYSRETEEEVRSVVVVGKSDKVYRWVLFFFFCFSCTAMTIKDLGASTMYYWQYAAIFRQIASH